MNLGCFWESKVDDKKVFIVKHLHYLYFHNVYCLRPCFRLAFSSFTAGLRQKYWTFGPSVRSCHFHVPLEKLQLNDLVTRVEKGGCTLVQGGYRTGKTSHLNALHERIQNRFFPLGYVKVFADICCAKNC